MPEPQPPTRRRDARLFGAALVALALVAATLVPVGFGDAPQDDAYISYVYARNFARGDGLVFNAGEPAVEGYTNYLWTVGIGWGMRAGLDPERIVPWLGLALTLATVLGTYLLARRLCATPVFAGLAALLFATRPMLAVHAMGGLETPLFGLLVLLAVLARLREREHPGGLGWSSSGVLALAALTRPEGCLVYGLLELFELAPVLRDPRSAGAAIRRTLVRAIPFVAVVGAHVAWRRATYGDWVPNTFHAKVDPGLVTFSDGARYVGRGLLFFGPLFFLLPFFVQAREPDRSGHRMCLWVGAVWVVYVVYAGGDYIPSYRFLWPVVPIWCALAASSVTRLTTHAGGQPRRTPTTVAVAAFLALLIGHTFSEYRFGHRWKGMDERHVQLVAAGRELNRILPEDAWIAVTNAGRIPYFADRRTLDMMGLSDAHIARRSAMSTTPELAGHLKGDGSYVLDRAPEAILFLRLVVRDRPLASSPKRRQLAGVLAFGVSEREIAADPRFREEYRLHSLPLDVPGQRVWLNVYARDGVFSDDPPPGLVVEPRES